MKFWLFPALGAVLFITRAQGHEPPESPEVLKDRRVIFRYDDPAAKEVKVKGIDRTMVDMERDPKGVWSVTVGPMDPGLYDYSFIVDGEQVIDPSNPEVKQEKNPNTSSLEITAALRADCH